MVHIANTHMQIVQTVFFIFVSILTVIVAIVCLISWPFILKLRYLFPFFSLSFFWSIYYSSLFFSGIRFSCVRVSSTFVWLHRGLFDSQNITIGPTEALLKSNYVCQKMHTSTQIHTHSHMFQVIKSEFTRMHSLTHLTDINEIKESNQMK